MPLLASFSALFWTAWFRAIHLSGQGCPATSKAYARNTNALKKQGCFQGAMHAVVHKPSNMGKVNHIFVTLNFTRL